MRNKARQVVVLLSLLLSGCIESDRPLFDASNAIEDQSIAGKYFTNEGSGLEQVSIVRDGKNYEIKYGTMTLRGMLFAFKDELLILQVEGRPPKYHYLIGAKSAGYVIFSFIECSWDRLPPNRASNKDCNLTSRDDVLMHAEAFRPNFQSSKMLVLIRQSDSELALKTATSASDGNVFQLKLCNTGGEDVFASVAYSEGLGKSRWIMKSWLSVPARKCEMSGSYPKGSIYLYAYAKGGLVWAGKDQNLCVGPRATERIIFPKEQCLVGEARMGFLEQRITTDQYSYTFNFPSKQ